MQCQQISSQEAQFCECFDLSKENKHQKRGLSLVNFSCWTGIANLWEVSSAEAQVEVEEKVFLHLWKIAPITPGFLWFSVQSVFELFAKQQKNPLLQSHPYKYKHEFCPDSTRILPGFLPRNRPYSVRIFTKMSSDEELVREAPF